MIEDIQQHLSHYAFLAFILMAGLIGFAWFNGNEPVQFFILIATGLGYLLWGIGHHLLEDNLTVTLVLEYALTSIIVTILVWGVFTNL